jgi:gas vesicle protein
MGKEAWRSIMSESNNPFESSEEQSSNRLIWFLAGVLAGSAAAVLLAPKSGRDTREFLSQKTQTGREAVEATSRDIVEASKDVYEKGRQLVEDAAELFERGRKLVRG